MDREKLFRQMDRQYSSKRDMITRIPLGVQPDALWQELLNRRRSRSTVLPLYNSKGAPYWYVTTEKMVAASEKIIETLYDMESDFDPYTDSVPISSLEEVFYTSYVDGSQIKGNVPTLSQLALGQISCEVLTATGLTDDPAKTGKPLTQLQAGTKVLYLTTMYNSGAWDYIETTIDGKVARGFVPSGTLDLDEVEELDAVDEMEAMEGDG